MITIDDYGLPIEILGKHPDDFYGSIGRIVCVCAVLEDKVTTLRHTLQRSQRDKDPRQGKHAHEPISKQIEVARSVVATNDSSPPDISRYLDRAEVAFRRRNELVHSSFPAQDDGRLWGHRPDRDKTVHDGRSTTVETSIDELKEFIAELSELVGRFNHIHVLACALAPN